MIVAEEVKTKCCTKCGVEKSLGEFHKNKQSRDGRRPDCKECFLRKDRERYHSDEERKARKNRRKAERYSERYHGDPEFRKRKRQWNADLYASSAEYRSENGARCAARRAAEHGSEGSHDGFDRRLVLYVHGEQCRYCGVSEEDHLEQSGKRLALDHVDPLSNGGSNDASNLVPCCRSCNQRKGSKPLSQFLSEIGADPNLGHYIRATCALVPTIREGMDQ